MPNIVDAGWVWEGQGLDPGVPPSVFGVGDGAEFFGLRKARYMFHDNNAIGLGRLAAMKAVSCDISKWRYRSVHDKAFECYCDSNPASVLAEAERVSKLSLQFPNIAGAFYDDLMGLLRREERGPEILGAIRDALHTHNPKLNLSCVVYTHELTETRFWKVVEKAVDEVTLWVWGFERLATLEEDLLRCRRLFPEKTILMGCYLRDYPSAAPMPMEAVQRQWRFLERALADERVQGYDILGTVLIDGQYDQACWVREFIQNRS